MDSIYTLYLIFAVLLTLAIARRRKDRFPPGPPGLPIVGNLFYSPKIHTWVDYQSWSTLYGTQRPAYRTLEYHSHASPTGSDIIHFKLFWSHVFVVSSSAVAKELFEKRSNIYSDRYALASTQHPAN